MQQIPILHWTQHCHAQGKFHLCNTFPRKFRIFLECSRNYNSVVLQNIKSSKFYNQILNVSRSSKLKWLFEKIPRENGFNLISRFSSFSAASVTMVTVAFWLTTVPTWTCTCSTAGRERHPDTCSDSQTHGPDIAAERGQHIGMLNKAISFLFISNPDRTCGFRWSKPSLYWLVLLESSKWAAQKMRYWPYLLTIRHHSHSIRYC